MFNVTGVPLQAENNTRAPAPNKKGSCWSLRLGVRSAFQSSLVHFRDLPIIQMNPPLIDLSFKNGGRLIVATGDLRSQQEPHQKWE